MVSGSEPESLRLDVEPYAADQQNGAGTNRSAGNQIIAVLFVFPLGLFLLLSFYKQIGLHWLLAFTPFVFLFVTLHLEDKTLQRDRTWNLWFGLPHLLLVLGLTYLPLDSFKTLRIHTDIVQIGRAHV